MNGRHSAALLAALLVLLDPRPALACPVCFGALDAPITTAMNMGIFVLLGFVGLVLAGVAAFMINVARRTRALREEAENWHEGIAGSGV